ncbi:MAG: tetratricopeptide repeat protein [Deltaproteobacteria bacterium]|nr:tetratricopeptide repeat protein [Deltaproteobacteria bacterium]
MPLGPPWRRHFHRGLRHLRDGETAEAAKAFEQALALNPDEPDVLLALARERLRQDRFDDAESLLQRVRQLKPSSVAAAALLARILGLHQGRREEAFGVVHQVLSRQPEAVALQIIRGELLLEEGALPEARDAFARALDHAPTDELARAGLARTFNCEGVALSENGEDERAVFCFKRAADLDPEWAGPYVNLGVVLGRLGRTERSLEAYRQALARDPSSPAAYYNLASTLHELGQRREAAELFERLLEVDPEYPQGRVALANVLGELGELDRAVALLLEELELAGPCARTFSSLGLAYVCSGNAERGEECLLRALELDPTYLNALYNLATLYATQERHTDAAALLERAFATDPERTAELFAGERRFDGLRRLEQFRFLH